MRFFKWPLISKIPPGANFILSVGKFMLPRSIMFHHAPTLIETGVGWFRRVATFLWKLSKFGKLCGSMGGNLGTGLRPSDGH